MENTEKNFIGKAFVGIDVHKNNWKVCVVGEHGFRKEFSCDPLTEVLVKSLLNLLPDFHFECAYEAGFSGFWLHDELNDYDEFSCIVVNAADIPTSDKERAQKEDRRDARKIATQLKAGGLKGIYVPSKSEVGLRELQRVQKTITKDLTRCQVRIKSFLMRHGITPPKEKFPTANHHWSGRFVKWLQTLEFTSIHLRITLDNLINSLIHFRGQKKNILKELRTQVKASEKEKEFELLTNNHGIGIIGAVTIITEVVDIKRFKTQEKFHSFIGLVPSTNSSDTVERIRGITNRSNRRLRNILIEASWVALRNDEYLFTYYHTLKQRMHSNKAIIRVAKKLASRIRYQWLELEKQKVMDIA